MGSVKAVMGTGISSGFGQRGLGAAEDDVWNWNAWARASSSLDTFARGLMELMLGTIVRDSVIVTPDSKLPRCYERERRL